MLHMQADASIPATLVSPQPHSEQILEAPQNLDTTQEKEEGLKITERTRSD